MNFSLKKSFKKFEIGSWNSETMTIYRKVNKQIWDEFELKQISASNLKAERFRRFFIEISVENADPSEFSDYYLLSLSQSTDLIEGAEDLVKWCYGKFKIGIIFWIFRALHTFRHILLLSNILCNT